MLRFRLDPPTYLLATAVARAEGLTLSELARRGLIAEALRLRRQHEAE
jgi:hypothetical protein